MLIVAFFSELEPEVFDYQWNDYYINLKRHHRPLPGQKLRRIRLVDLEL